MKLNQMKINASLIEEGKWINDIPSMGDLRLKVRGENSVEFRAVRDRLVDLQPREERLRGISPGVSDRIEAEAIARGTLLDWANLFDDEGHPIDFSADRAVEVLTNPDFGQFLAAVRWASRAVTVEASA